jgi:hypothetical protein
MEVPIAKEEFTKKFHQFGGKIAPAEELYNFVSQTGACLFMIF